MDIEAVMDIEGGIKVKKKKNKDDYKDNNEGNSDWQTSGYFVLILQIESIRIRPVLDAFFNGCGLVCPRGLDEWWSYRNV